MNSTQKKFNELLNAIPDEVNQYVELQGDIAVRIGKIIDKKDWTQKKLAAEMKWNESQVTRLLAGHENLTLKTIAKLSTVLGEPLIQVAGYAKPQTSRAAAAVTYVNLDMEMLNIAGYEFSKEIRVSVSEAYGSYVIGQNSKFRIQSNKLNTPVTLYEKKECA